MKKIGMGLSWAKSQDQGQKIDLYSDFLDKKQRWRDKIDEMLQSKQFHRVANYRAKWARLREAFAQQRIFMYINNL